MASAPSGSSVVGVSPVSRCSFRSHLASLEASEQVMYSASVVDLAIKSRFRDCHEMAQLFKINTYPPCNLRSALLFAQLESVQPAIALSPLLRSVGSVGSRLEEPQHAPGSREVGFGQA